MTVTVLMRGAVVAFRLFAAIMTGMIRRYAHTVASDRAGTRLDALVAAWLSDELAQPLSKAAVRKLIVAGAIRLDGRVARVPAAVVPVGSTLRAAIDVSRLNPPRSEAAPASVTVLYEDEVLIAVDKPAGVPTHATADRARADLVTLVQTMLAARSSADAARPPYLGVHHRLDVDTSGVVLFTKAERANQGLAQQFGHREIDKLYHAIVVRPRGRVPRAWRIENQLAPSGAGRHARMASVDAGGVSAVTDFELLDLLPVALLVEAHPRTGRKHQIRAHLAGWGAPILGDGRYGGPPLAGG
jgi:RluA family pseudouridine synthase